MNRSLFALLVFFCLQLCAFSIEENLDPIVLEDTNEEETLLDEDENNDNNVIQWGIKKNEIYTLDNYATDELSSSANIDTITQKDIEKQDFPQLTKLLNEAGSVTTNTANGSDGSVSSVRIRGTDRVRMTIDGIRVDRPSSTASSAETQFILSDDIESIEVIKGPQGNVSGTNASGGAIAMRTRRGQGPFKVELGSDFGSKGTFKERAALMGSTEKTDYYLSTTWYKTDGGMRTKQLGDVQNDGYNNYNVVSNIGRRFLNNKAELRNVFRFSRARKELGANSYYDWMTGKYKPYQDRNNYGKNIDVLDSLTFTHAPNEKYNYNVRFGVMHNRNENYLLQDMFNTYDSTANIGSTRLNFMTQHNFKITDWNTLSIGYNLENEYMKGKSTYASWGSEYISNYKGTTLQNDVYVHDVINIKDKLYIRGGGRLINHGDFGTYIVPNGSVALVLPTFKLSGAKTKFKGSWGQSVNMPTLYQRFGRLYDGWTLSTGNPNLKAEKLTGFDFGIEQYLMDEKLKFEANYFNSSYKNYINYFTTEDWTLGYYYNIDEARIYGYEGKMTFEPNDKFKVVFNYTYTSSTDKTTGMDLPAIPSNRFNTMVYYTPFERWTLYAGVETASSRQMTANAPDKSRGYVDARIGTKIRLFSIKDLNFYLKGNIYNLFNQNICMYGYPSSNEYYYAPKLRYNIGIFVDYELKRSKKDKEEKV